MMTHHLSSGMHPQIPTLGMARCCISTQLPHTLKDGSHNLPATIRTEYTASPELTTHLVQCVHARTSDECTQAVFHHGRSINNMWRAVL